MIEIVFKLKTKTVHTYIVRVLPISHLGGQVCYERVVMCLNLKYINVLSSNYENGTIFAGFCCFLDE